MKTAPALRLHSVMLGVRDLDVSVAFYNDKVGMTLRGRFGDFALLETGGFTITLSSQLMRARRTAASFPVEVALSVDGVRNAYDALRSRDVLVLNEPHTIDGRYDVANFEDPDGHLFSLYGSP